MNLALNIISVVSIVDVCDWFLQVHDNITYHTKCEVVLYTFTPTEIHSYINKVSVNTYVL